MFTIYALVSETGKWIYVGFTSDLNDRFFRHLNGYERTTAPYRPFKCFELATAFTRSEARKIEKWYKTSYGKSCVRQLLAQNSLPPFHGGFTSLSANR